MKLGQKVTLKSTGQMARIIGINDTKIHIKTLDTGTILAVTRDAVVIVGLITKLWGMIKGLVSDVVNTFKNAKK